MAWLEGFYDRVEWLAGLIEQSADWLEWLARSGEAV